MNRRSSNPAAPKPRRTTRSWREKPADSKDLPKVVTLDSGASLAIPAPSEVDQLIRHLVLILCSLAATIAATGASVQDIRHERVFGGPDISRVRVACIVEVRDSRHADELQEALRSHGVFVHERVRPHRERPSA